MESIDLFLRSVRVAFRASEGQGSTAIGFGVFVAALVGAALLITERTRRRARREENAIIAAIAAERRLSAPDVAHVVSLARAAKQSPPLVMTVLAVFERVTARALAEHPPSRDPHPGDAPSRIGQLREALGFIPLPAHAPMLSTRELSVGAPVKVGEVTTHVVEVNEAHFCVSGDGAARELDLELDAPASFELIRPAEARYTFTARLVALDSRGRRLVFSHNESPQRIQLREAVRVRVGCSVVVRPHNDESTEPVQAHALDVSVGGLLLESPRAFISGSSVRCTFELAPGAIFSSLLARVVQSQPSARHDGRFRVRLSFVDLSRADHDHLLATVTHLDAQSAAAVRAERQSTGRFPVAR